MSYLAPLAVVALLLAGCVETGRTAGGPPPKAMTDSTVIVTDSTTIVVNYPLSQLPMSDPVRMQTTFALSHLASPEARRACSAEEIEFTNLSIILYAVRDEEWRTSPWTAKQKREVERLQQRWRVLGGDGRTVSPTCQRVIARL